MNTASQPAAGGGAKPMAKVRYGVHENTILAKDNIKVGDVQTSFASHWHMPNDVTALVNGEAAPKNYVIQPGDTVEFYRASGEKG